jgi:hypothetical protein
VRWALVGACCIVAALVGTLGASVAMVAVALR